MSEKEPTIQEIHVWIASEIRDAQKQLLTSKEKYIHRNFIRMMKAVHRYLGQPHVPKVVTREYLCKWMEICSPSKQYEHMMDWMIAFLADLGFIVEKERP